MRNNAKMVYSALIAVTIFALFANLPLPENFLQTKTAFAESTVVGVQTYAESTVVGVQTYGAEYGEWSARWWQWLLSIPLKFNPNLDVTGANCAQGQVGNVWFLAGNFGGTSVRTCTIPAGKPIFFPVINQLAFDPFPSETLLDIRMQAAPPIDAATHLVATIDGKRAVKDLRAFRVQSPVFSTVIPADPPDGFLIGAGLHPMMVTDGYWLLLEPLKPGHHTINFKASSNGFSLDVTYHLIVQ